MDERETAMEEYVRHAAPVLADLERAGYPALGAVQDLVRSGLRYEAAIPILAKWLPEVRYFPLKQDVVRALAVPWARPALDPLLQEFQRESYGLLPDAARNPDASIRMAIGNSLEVLASDERYEEYVQIATDRHWGRERWFVVMGLAKMLRHEGVLRVLESLVDDEQVVVPAVEALARLKRPDSREVLARLIHHESPFVRRRAAQVMSAIEKRTLGKESGRG